MVELLLLQRFENLEQQSISGSQVRFSQNIDQRKKSLSHQSAAFESNDKSSSVFGKKDEKLTNQSGDEKHQILIE